VIGHQFWILFNYPDGIVVGNLLASLLWVLIVAATIFVLRDWIGPRLVAFLHRHHVAHLEKLERMVAPDGISSGSDIPRPSSPQG
jgi:hypothetical protein